jgi:hypothetical protein
MVIVTAPRPMNMIRGELQFEGDWRVRGSVH